MKKLILLSILVLSANFVLRAQEWVFAEQLASTGAVSPTDIRIDNNGDVYIVGNYINPLTIGGLAPLPYSDLNNKEDIYLCKFDGRGNALWARQIASSNRELIGGLAIDPSNNVYVVGGFQGDTLRFQGEATELINTETGGGKYDAFVAKYNSSGGLITADRVFYGTNVQRLLDATFDRTKNYLVLVGQFQGQLQYDSSGVQTLSAVSQKDHLLARLNTDLSFVDKVVFNGSIKQTVFKNVNNCVIADTVNSYFVTGDLVGNLLDASSTVLLSAADASNMDIMVLKISDKMVYQWGRKGGSAADFEHINSSGSDAFGNIYFTGKAQSPSISIDSTATLSSVPRLSLGGQDYLIAKYNRSGNLQWFNRDGGPGVDNAYGLSVRGQRLLYSGNIDNGGNISSGFSVYDLNGNIITTDSITGDGEESGLNVIFGPSGDSTLVIGTFNGDSLKAGPYRLDNTSPGVTDGFLVKYGYKFRVYEANATHILCYGASTGSIEVETEFGTPPITYVWTPDVSSSNVATDLPAGTYKIVATGTGGRKDSIEITLTQPDDLASSLENATATSCNVLASSGNKNNGALDISVSGGKEPYTYFWSPGGQTTQDISNVGAGNHVVTITDANSCVEVDTFLVPEPPEVSHEGSVVDTITIPPGNNGAVHLNTSGGTPDYSFSWTGPPGFIPSTDDTIKDLQYSGDYFLEVTDANSCVFNTTFNVPVDTGLTVTICDFRHVSCKDDEDGYARVCVTFGGSGSYSYAWRTSGGTPVGTNDDELTNVPAGTYIVKVTDLVSTSTNETSITIEEPASFLTLGVDSTWNASCHGTCDGAIFISVNGGWGGYTYLWTPTNKITQDVFDLCPQTYSVQVSDTGLNTGVCVKQITGIDIDEPSEVTVTIQDYEIISCNGGTGRLLAKARGGTAPYSFVWDDPGAQNDSIANDLFAGLYNCDVTDANGCPATDNHILTEPAVLTFTIDTIQDTQEGSCVGEIVIRARGGTPPYQFRLLNGDFQTDSTFSDLCAGWDTVEVVDANGCGESGSFALPVDNVLDNRSITIYPNPSGGEFTFEMVNRNAEDILLEIINITGRVVYKQHYKYDGNTQFIKVIELGKQEKGIYLLRVNGLPLRSKIMIQ
jgi:hypothetical protein